MTRPAITNMTVEELRGAARVLRDVLAATTSLTEAAGVRALLEREAAIAEGIIENAEAEEDEAAQTGLADAVAHHLAQDGSSSPGASRVAPSAPAPESGQPSEATLPKRKGGGRWTPERRARQAELLRERKGGQSPWTPERLKLLHASYPTADLRKLLDELNALPGFALGHVDSIRYRAEKDGLRRDEATLQAVKREAMRRANEKRLTGELPPVGSISAKEQDAIRERCRDYISATGLRHHQAADAAGVPVGSLSPWMAGQAASGTAAKVRAWLDSVNAPEAPPPPAPHGVKAQPEPEDGSPPDWIADAEEEARTMHAAGKGARDLSAWFGGSLSWWQAWCERERQAVGRAA